MSHYYFACYDTIEAEVRTRVNNRFAQSADGEGDEVILGTAVYGTAAGQRWAAWCHPCSPALAAKIQARINAMPLAVRSKLRILDAVPPGWVPETNV